LVNTFASGLNQVVRAKTTGLHMVLRGNSSSPENATDPVKSSKDSASLVGCTLKKIFWLGVQIFCEWCHKWRTFRPP